MHTVSEEQRRQTAATKKDPLIQFIFQKARSDIMNGKAVDVGQPQQQQQATNESLGASQRGPEVPIPLSAMMTQVSLNDTSTATATIPSGAIHATVIPFDSDK